MAVFSSAPPRRAGKNERAKINKKLPPGQRLLVYLGLAGLIVFLQGYSEPAENPSASQETAVPVAAVAVPPFRMNRELSELETMLRMQADKPHLRAGLFVVEPSTGSYADLNGHESYAAASMIKVPVLVAMLVALDKKMVAMDQLLTIRQDLVAGGSGYLQWRPIGTRIPLSEAAELMITHSDNTATNLIIENLGGIEPLNRQFAAWGLKETRINNLLPDFPGTNKTSPYDLAYLLGIADTGKILSADSRQFMFKIMERTRTRTLLPPGLGVGAKIAHKTGDIGGMVGDAGIVTAPAGQRYIVVAQVERPHNDRTANELIRSLSRTVYAALVPDAKFAPAEVARPSKNAGRTRHKHRRRHR
jgi:beta-lactamase class A